MVSIADFCDGANGLPFVIVNKIKLNRVENIATVSYTNLTLPTICSV